MHCTRLQHAYLVELVGIKPQARADDHDRSDVTSKLQQCTSERQYIYRGFGVSAVAPWSDELASDPAEVSSLTQARSSAPLFCHCRFPARIPWLVPNVVTSYTLTKTVHVARMVH